MLAILLAIIAAAPSPQPSADAANPLRTIVTVHSTTFCQQFANHVNSAIDSAVRNDAVVGSTILMLRSNELADNELSRMREIRKLEEMGDKLYKDYRAGLAEVDRLRDLAKNAPTPEEAKDMKDAADALGGILYRQHLIQRDLDGFTAYLDAADMQADTNRDKLEAEFNGNAAANFPYAGPNGEMSPMQASNVGMQLGREATHPYDYRTPATDVVLANNASRDFQSRLPDILRDEVDASGKVTQANTHC